MSHTRATHRPLQERDVISRRVLYAAVAGLLVLLFAGWVITWIADRGMSFRTGARGPSVAVKVVPREVEMIDQTLFVAHEPSRGDWAQKQRELDSYEWVDRTNGVVRIPIERAMDLLAERGRVE